MKLVTTFTPSALGVGSWELGVGGWELICSRALRDFRRAVAPIEAMYRDAKDRHLIRRSAAAADAEALQFADTVPMTLPARRIAR